MFERFGRLPEWLKGIPPTAGLNRRMDYAVYILKNPNDKYYIGQTFNLDRRILQHNNNECKSTKFSGPWLIVHIEKFGNRSKAMAREKQIKSYKGGEAFKRLIQK